MGTRFFMDSILNLSEKSFRGWAIKQTKKRAFKNTYSVNFHISYLFLYREPHTVEYLCSDDFRIDATLREVHVRKSYPKEQIEYFRDYGEDFVEALFESDFYNPIANEVRKMNS